MKSLLWLAALASLGISVLPWGSKAASESIILLPDFNGELTPCGCTKPMIGGILRLGSAVASLQAQSQSVIVSNGSWVAGIGRQDELKAEAAAEALKAMKVDAVNLSVSEAKLGVAEVAAIQRLLGEDRLLSSCLESGDAVSLQKFASAKPFLIGGIVSDPKRLGELTRSQNFSIEQAVQSLIEESKESKLLPVLLFSGTKFEAMNVAKAHPGLALVCYSSDSEPEGTPTIVGKTWIVTAGSRGKHVVQVGFSEGQCSSLKVIDLNSKFANDETIKRLYNTYQKRVADEELLESLPRSADAGFVGTKTCGSCHQSALNVWKRSAHSQSLKTLERDGHGRDPDCVRCHVVGLEFRDGFKSQSQTEDLANVGCEACHGPGKMHAVRPTVKLPKFEQSVCLSCHNLNHDPEFDFRTYWKKIKH